jgi:hypothetical protein
VIILAFRVLAASLLLAFRIETSNSGRYRAWTGGRALLAAINVINFINPVAPKDPRAPAWAIAESSSRRLPLRSSRQCFLTFVRCRCFPRRNSKPNIILILADDMGYFDIGRFGSKVSTP